MLRDLRGDDLNGIDRLTLLLTVALADHVLVQIRLDQGDNDAATELLTLQQARSGIQQETHADGRTAGNDFDRTLPSCPFLL